MMSDRIGFLDADDLKNTVAYKIFDLRLQDEIRKGNPAAIEIKKVLEGEPK